MKTTPKYLKIDIPLRYDDEDMPYDFPLRQKGQDGNDDTWVATIDLKTGEILNFPKDVSLDFFTKVCDEGLYYLLDENMNIFAEADCSGYVPNHAIPPKDGYGDYIHLHIQNGIVVNLYDNPDFCEFENKESEEGK